MSKTFFAPGKPLTSTWLNGSQYFGSISPGITFTSNPINDWQYPLLLSTSIDVADFSNTFVARSGNTIIDGIKTFTSIPVSPTPSLATLSGTQVVNIDYFQGALSNRLASESYVTTGTTQTISGQKTFADIRVPSIPFFPDQPISKSYADTSYIDTTTTQNITGQKTFASIKVPLTPSSTNDPVSLQYFNNSAVKTTGNQVISGTKTFDDPRVPLTATTTNSAVSKSHLEGYAVSLSGTQTISGVKTFASPITIPNAVQLTEAVNLQQLNAATSGFRSGSFYISSVGGIKIISGKVATGVKNWAAGGPITDIITYPAPSGDWTGFLQPPVISLSYEGPASATLDYLYVLQTPAPTVNNFTWQADAGGIPSSSITIHYIAMGV